jgi:hypothetical protein
VSGLYAADGSINVTVVDGSVTTGLYATDGSINVVLAPGGTYVGATHACGALYVTLAPSSLTGRRAADGSLYVITTPYTSDTAAQAVTAVSGSLSPSSYIAKAVHFNGSAEVGLTNQSAILAADASTGLLSVWLQGSDIFNSTNSAGGALVYDNNNGNCIFSCINNIPNSFSFGFDNAANTSHYFNSSNPSGPGIMPTSGWFNLLASWDMSVAPTPIFQLYFSDVLQTFPSPPGILNPPFTINYADTAWQIIGADNPGTGTAVICDAADFQLWCGGIFVDLSVTANRRKFIDGSSKPVDPATAATAFGQQTYLLSGDHTHFPTNGGSGSATSLLAGALTDASTHP